MGTGLTCGFATTSDRGILQRAHDTLDEEIDESFGDPDYFCEPFEAEEWRAAVGREDLRSRRGGFGADSRTRSSIGADS
jgi:hypothetical protein